MSASAVARSLILSFAVTLPGVAAADVLRIPSGTTAPDVTLPDRGTTMTQVEARFGAPAQRHQQVGGGHAKRPPITRWDYERFYVVFERDRVINAVQPDRPTPLQRTDELEVRTETLGAN